MKVELLSTQGVIATVHILGGEPAQFRVTTGRTYRLTVSGMGIEAVTTANFTINNLEQNRLRNHSCETGEPKDRRRIDLRPGHDFRQRNECSQEGKHRNE